MPPATLQNLNKSIEQLNSASTALGKERGVKLDTISTIPVNVAEQNVPNLEIPQITPDPEPVVSGALSATDSFIANANQQLAASQQAVNDRNLTIEDLFGALNTQEGAQSELLATEVDPIQSRLSEQLTNIGFRRDQVANDDALSFFNQIGAKEDIGQRGGLASAGNAASRRIQIDRAIQRANQGIELRSMVAEAELTQGRLDSARTQVQRALDAKYKPLTQQLEMEKFFAGQDYNRLSTAEKRQADAQIFLVEQEQEQINRAESLVDASLQYAQPGEVQNLMSLETPQQQIAAATQIIARGQASDRNLDRSAKLASASAANALAATRGVEKQIKELELNSLQNPSLNAVDPNTIEAIDSLTDGQRGDILNARETVNELDRMIELVGSVSDVSLLSKGTEEGREFQRISRNVVDKLARERTGAVVGADEEAAFIDIVGVGIFNLVAKDDEELMQGLTSLKQKHDESLQLNDPQGIVRDFLDGQPAFQTDEPEDAAQAEIGAVVTINGVSYRKVGDDEFIQL